MYTECQESHLLAVYGTEIPVEANLFEPQFTKSEVAKILKCSVKSIERYITFGWGYIDSLKKYMDDFGFLNRRKIDSSDIVFLEEIQDLKSKFSQDRVIQILTRRYINK